jgi:1-acyl-sn-glycerol-3-phosphate acyltransferase
VARRKRGWVLVTIASIIRPLLLVLTKRSWRGLEHIPRDQGFVFVANHISHADPLLFAHFAYDNNVPPRFLAKQGVFKYPVIGRILLATGQIPVRRGTTDVTSSFAGALEAVEQGYGVIVYAEGSITRDPDLWPMVGKTGAARLALQTGAPVIPVAQWGAHEVLWPYTKWPRLFPRKTIHVQVGPPVELDDLRGRKVTSPLLHEATDRIMADVTKLLGEIRDDKPPEVRFDPRAHGLPETGNPGRPYNRPETA